MSVEKNQRDLEAGIHTDLQGRLTYGGYLRLDQLLVAQQPLSNPPHHDEMLFIIQHQTSELWLKLLVHELTRGDRLPARDEVWQCRKVRRAASRCWPADRAVVGAGNADPVGIHGFRDMLGPSSGFQSLQYRYIEFLMGNKNARCCKVFSHDPAGQAQLQRSAGRAKPVRGIPALPGALRPRRYRPSTLERDWQQPHVADDALHPVFERIYQNTDRFWREYSLCEDLVDLETAFQLWRFRHMRTVMRVIGFKRGTGGSSGVGFLRQALELTFFPELFQVRTTIRNDDPMPPDA